MQVENGAGKRGIPVSNIESALLFETPDELFARVVRQIHPAFPGARLDVSFRPSVRLSSSIRLVDGVLRVRLSDVLETAPAPILESLAFILVSKLFRRRLDDIHRLRYRLWLNRQEGQGVPLRQDRGKKHCDPPGGSHYCLNEVFDAVNARFFDGEVARPALGWSRRQSRTRIGRYEPLRHAIILNRILDSPEAPRRLVEYVMYHEILHIVHPPEYRRSRRVVHTRAFRVAEKQFPEYAEARMDLKMLLGESL